MFTKKSWCLVTILATGELVQIPYKPLEAIKLTILVT